MQFNDIEKCLELQMPRKSIFNRKQIQNHNSAHLG